MVSTNIKESNHHRIQLAIEKASFLGLISPLEHPRPCDNELTNSMNIIILDGKACANGNLEI